MDLPDLIPAVCGCGASMMIRRTLPDSVPEHLRHLPRVPTCIDCAKAVAAEAPDGTVRVFHRKTTAKQPWRTTDGLEHPVVTNTNTQEDDVKIDLNTMSDAEIGAEVRKTMQESIAAALPARRKKAKKKAKAKATKDHVERRALAAGVQAIDGLVAFQVRDLEVPALDISDLTSLDEVVPGTVRSVYNKALHRLEATRGRLVGKEATWAEVVALHLELVPLAAADAEARAAKKAAKKKATTTVTAVEIDLGAKAKRKAAVEAVMAARGCSKAEAKKILAKVGA